MRRRIVPRSSAKFPLATVAWYGPDDQRATKVAVGIFAKRGDLTEIRRWHSEETDVREDARIAQEIVAFCQEHNVRETAVADGIIGCPHEEGIDFPEGTVCPKCTFWRAAELEAKEEIEARASKPGRNDPCRCGSGKKYKKCCGA